MEGSGNDPSLGASMNLLETLQSDGDRKSFRYGMSNAEFEMRQSKMDFLNLMRDPRTAALLPPPPRRSIQDDGKKDEEEEEEEEDLLQTLMNERNKSFRHKMTPAEFELSRSRLDALNLMRDERSKASGIRFSYQEEREDSQEFQSTLRAEPKAFRHRSQSTTPYDMRRSRKEALMTMKDDRSKELPTLHDMKQSEGWNDSLNLQGTLQATSPRSFRGKKN